MGIKNDLPKNKGYSQCKKKHLEKVLAMLFEVEHSFLFRRAFTIDILIPSYNTKGNRTLLRNGGKASLTKKMHESPLPLVVVKFRRLLFPPKPIY